MFLRGHDHGLIKLKPEFKPERQRERVASFKYYMPHEQAEACVKADNNHCYRTASGNKAHGDCAYVTLENFKHICTYSRSVHHSALSNGKKVRGAGIFTFLFL